MIFDMKTLSKFQILPLILIFCSSYGYCQKPCIDSSVYGKWPSVSTPSINNNGSYASYIIRNKPIGGQTLVCQGIRTKWKVEIPGGDNLQFTSDNYSAIFSLPGDSLGIVKMGSDSVVYISDVLSFDLFHWNIGDYLVYRLKLPKGRLVVRNMKTGGQICFEHVKKYLFGSEGKALVTNVGSVDNLDSLNWTDLTRSSVTPIFKGPNLDNFVFDSSNTQFCFTMGESKAVAPVGKSLCYYKVGQDRASVVGNDKSINIDSAFGLDRLIRFTSDGRGIFFTLRKNEDKVQARRARIDLKVWNYNDPKLQAFDRDEGVRYTSVLRFGVGKIIRLEGSGDQILYGLSRGSYQNVALVRHRTGVDYEREWNKMSRSGYYLVSTKDGSKKLFSGVLCQAFSPDGKYFIYYDLLKRNYFSYQLSTGICRNITRGIITEWTEYDDQPDSSSAVRGVAGFMENNKSVFIYSRNDIYQVALDGLVPSVNLTQHDRDKTDIEFSFAIKHVSVYVRTGEKLILNAFNRDTKDNGFYSVVIGGRRSLTPLIMQSYIFEGTDGNDLFLADPPLKSRDTDMYIVRRMSSSESPNYFWTTDFKSFSPITDIYPERKYNWLTTQLITWRTFDGSYSSGILYKPEDFDPQKKYPVIFYYYERLSDGLHAFILPDYSQGPINIPSFVGKGYLVFVPDIYYKVGYPGKSVYNAVVSSAIYLSKFPWVDSKKMGIQGHSWGGYETNYLITHTHIFAAAISCEGIADFVSGYGGLPGRGFSDQFFYELSQCRIGVTLWQRPDLYIINSPVFYANKVGTPLLLEDNDKDAQVPFAQGMELFTALRRLGKPVWMIQYLGEGHVVSGKIAYDLGSRMAQFFDYFLKNADMPLWMDRSKGSMSDNLNLYPLGKGSNQGLLSEDARKIARSLESRKPVEVIIR